MRHARYNPPMHPYRTAALVVIMGALGIAAIPFAFLWTVTGSAVPDILPSLQSDTLYYLAQIRDVLDGHPWLGNPYIREYAHLRSPSLVLPVWIAALPGLFGFTINQIFFLNAVFYTVVTALLLFVLLQRLTGGNRGLSVVAALMTTAYIHNLILRPAVMQTVYPVFLLFLLALHAHLRRPNNRWTIVVLGIVAVLSFYHYLYLWMIVFACLGLLTLQSIWYRDRAAILRWAILWAGVALLSVPEMLHIVSSLEDPLMQEASYRIGLVTTRLIQPTTVLNAKYLLLCAAGIIAIRFWRKTRWTPEEMTLLLALAGILLVTFSNVVTGKDMELLTHPWRFGLILTGLCFAYFLQESWKNGRTRIIGIGMACLLLATMSVHIVFRSNAFAYLKNGEAIAREASLAAECTDVLAALDSIEETGVIVAPPSCHPLVPMYTHHSVLFDDSARLHPVPTEELLERFLLQRMATGEAEAGIRHSLSAIVGIGPRHEAEQKNLRNAYCRTFRLCADDGIVYAEADVAAIDALTALASAIASRLRSDIPGSLERFGVTHIVRDRTRQRGGDISASGTVIYQDLRWEIVALR